ncbi:MAG TPA: hypothetical protein VMN37_01575 [Gemmatimonadales bacterium]|nr:hypothetical protein [Gemmatimonadales bacterium]
MYRIEVSTGEETVFRTIDELATGIRNGLITPRSRIYHGASQKWLPIEFHPHYKKALDLVTGGAPMIDVGPLRPPREPRRTPAPAPEPRRPEPPRSSPPKPEPQRFDAPRYGAPRFDQPRFGPPQSEAVAVTAPEIEAPAIEEPPVEPAAYAPPRVEPARYEGPAAEVELPRISYPEIPPPAGTDEFHPVARRRPTGRAPWKLVGVVVAVLAGGYYATTSAAPGSEPAPATVAPVHEEFRAAAEVEDQAPPPVESTATPKPVHAAPPPPAGLPAWADQPATRPEGPVSQAWSSSAGAIAPLHRPAPAPTALPAEPDVPAIAPLPGVVDLTLPQRPEVESIGASTRASRDSATMKQILRAVSGQPGSGKAAR